MANKDIARLDARIDHLEERVSSLIDRFDGHFGNHHGSWSFWRQNTLAATLGACLVFIVEIVRQFI